MRINLSRYSIFCSVLLFGIIAMAGCGKKEEHQAIRYMPPPAGAQAPVVPPEKELRSDKKGGD